MPSTTHVSTLKLAADNINFRPFAADLDTAGRIAEREEERTGRRVYKSDILREALRIGLAQMERTK